MKKFATPQQVYNLLKGKTDGKKLLSDILPPLLYCTENIQWRELLLHQVDNPSLEILTNLFGIANRLQAFRDTIFQGNPITINSAYRSPAYNKKIGGEDNSKHCLGQAIDFTVANIMPQHVQDLLVNHSGGLGSYSSFTHIDGSNKRRWRG